MHRVPTFRCCDSVFQLYQTSQRICDSLLTTDPTSLGETAKARTVWSGSLWSIAQFRHREAASLPDLAHVGAHNTTIGEARAKHLSKDLSVCSGPIPRFSLVLRSNQPILTEG